MRVKERFALLATVEPLSFEASKVRFAWHQSCLFASTLRKRLPDADTPSRTFNEGLRITATTLRASALSPIKASVVSRSFVKRIFWFRTVAGSCVAIVVTVF